MIEEMVQVEEEEEGGAEEVEGEEGMREEFAGQDRQLIVAAVPLLDHPLGDQDHVPPTAVAILLHLVVEEIETGMGATPEQNEDADHLHALPLVHHPQDQVLVIHLARHPLLVPQDLPHEEDTPRPPLAHHHVHGEELEEEDKLIMVEQIEDNQKCWKKMSARL